MATDNKNNFLFRWEQLKTFWEKLKDLIKTKADDSKVVHLTDNETVSGTKTYSNNIYAPNSSSVSICQENCYDIPNGSSVAKAIKSSEESLQDLIDKKMDINSVNGVELSGVYSWGLWSPSNILTKDNYFKFIEMSVSNNGGYKSFLIFEIFAFGDPGNSAYYGEYLLSMYKAGSISYIYLDCLKFKSISNIQRLKADDICFTNQGNKISIYRKNSFNQTIDGIWQVNIKCAEVKFTEYRFYSASQRNPNETSETLVKGHNNKFYLCKSNTSINEENLTKTEGTITYASLP